MNCSLMYGSLNSLLSGFGCPAEDPSNRLHQEPKPRGLSSEGRGGRQEAGEQGQHRALQVEHRLQER